VTRVLRLAAGALLGVAIGTLAWGEGRAPLLAVLLPFSLTLCATRAQAFALAFGYACGTLRYVAAFIAGWFDGNLWIGFGALCIYGVMSGAVWCLAWSESTSGLRRGAVVVAAWTIALLPPAAPGVAGHPVIAAGYLLPGSGWFGVLVSILMPAGIVWACARSGVPVARQRVGAVAVAVVLVALGFTLGVPSSSSTAHGVYAMRTSFGALQSQDDAISRIEAMGREGRPQGAVAVIWPESIIGRYDTALYPVLKLELLSPSQSVGLVQVVGMDIPLPGDRLQNSAIAFYPDGSAATATARQPAPVSLWKPWRSDKTFIADWTSSNMLALGQGDRAAVIFCYEEYMPVLYLINELRDSPTLYLAVANTWAAREKAAAEVQRLHSLGMARLFGRPYLKAENRPRPDNGSVQASSPAAAASAPPLP
jgi:hypothetical protein